MAYATAQDMLDRFGASEMEQLTDISKPRLNAVDSVVLDRALEDATALINGYLISRYSLPLASVPDNLKVMCCGIARYQLMSRSPDDRAKADYENAFKFLVGVNRGDVQLFPPSAAPAVDGVGPVLFNAGSKIMGRDAY
jgi:phage gp36-like protein